MDNNLPGDGIHSTDLERLRQLRDPNIEEVTVLLHHGEKRLILKVNGIDIKIKDVKKLVDNEVEQDNKLSIAT